VENPGSDGTEQISAKYADSMAGHHDQIDSMSGRVVRNHGRSFAVFDQTGHNEIIEARRSERLQSPCRGLAHPGDPCVGRRRIRCIKALIVADRVNEYDLAVELARNCRD